MDTDGQGFQEGSFESKIWIKKMKDNADEVKTGRGAERRNRDLKRMDTDFYRRQQRKGGARWRRRKCNSRPEEFLAAWPQRALAGNTIDFFVQVLGLSFHQAM